MIIWSLLNTGEKGAKLKVLLLNKSLIRINLQGPVLQSYACTAINRVYDTGP